LHRRYGKQATFLAVYVREAHPGDGAWPHEFKNESGGPINQPKQLGERESVASECSKTLHISMPLLVDEVDDRVGRAYSGMPDRLYVIDRQGQITYKGGRGPFGFKPGEMEQALLMTLLDEQTNDLPTVAGTEDTQP
jgi:hypothetical protein